MTKTPVRARARALAILVPFLCVLGVGAACTEQQRSNGESCLKSADCLSGVCANFTCVASPPLLDAEVNGDGTVQGAGDAADGASEATPPKEAGQDTAPPMEAATEAGPDGAGDGGGDGSTD